MLKSDPKTLVSYIGHTLEFNTEEDAPFFITKELAKKMLEGINSSDDVLLFGGGISVYFVVDGIEHRIVGDNFIDVNEYIRNMEGTDGKEEKELIEEMIYYNENYNTDFCILDDKRYILVNAGASPINCFKWDWRITHKYIIRATFGGKKIYLPLGKYSHELIQQILN